MPPEREEFGPLVVHIIEDDDAVADALSLALEALDRLSRTYPDGETFLAGAELTSEDWVIVDLGLPGVSGTEIVRMLSLMPQPPRVLAISGKTQAKLTQHLRDMPDMKVLRKPLSIEAICAALA
ncbi:response regulator [Roseibium marinum]|uniref:Response regulator receiver domain-containing protein n=1 Tax=Roseibium marinum TaxID=281252 RepID=A0A2S3UWJ3_9HYPH|nr:response regulator [Roseibium marinum]POF32092.1 response regulator receiver domain-containing protein [Roseibium marinum]